MVYGPQFIRKRPPWFPNLDHDGAPGGGVGGGAASGQWGSSGADRFSKIFGPSVLKPKRERRPKEETRKIERSFRCSCVGLSTIAS